MSVGSEFHMSDAATYNFGQIMSLHDAFASWFVHRAQYVASRPYCVQKYLQNEFRVG